MYFVFQIFSELPFHTFYVAVYTVPVYFIAGLKMNIFDFLTVFAILFLLVYCSRTLAMFSASVMPTFQLSCFFAQTFFSMYIMSAGFFINLDNIFDGKLTCRYWVHMLQLTCDGPFPVAFTYTNYPLLLSHTLIFYSRKKFNNTTVY